VQEIWHTIHQSKKKSNQWFLAKVDMDKAYDRLNWEFIKKSGQTGS